MAVILVDVDGTLTKSVAWTPYECEVAEPRPEVIERVNQLYLTNFIVIYTARRDELIPATLVWLRKNGVRFNALSNNKCGGELLIDDKCVNVEDFIRNPLPTFNRGG